MAHRIEPLSVAQIHGIYAPKTKPREKPADEGEPVHYSKTSFSGRESGHPGSPPPPPESKGKKGRR